MIPPVRVRFALEKLHINAGHPGYELHKGHLPLLLCVQARHVHPGSVHRAAIPFHIRLLQGLLHLYFLGHLYSRLPRLLTQFKGPVQLRVVQSFGEDASFQGFHAGRSTVGVIVSRLHPRCHTRRNLVVSQRRDKAVGKRRVLHVGAYGISRSLPVASIGHVVQVHFLHLAVLVAHVECGLVAHAGNAQQLHVLAVHLALRVFSLAHLHHGFAPLRRLLHALGRLLHPLRSLDVRLHVAVQARALQVVIHGKQRILYSALDLRAVLPVDGSFHGPALPIGCNSFPHSGNAVHSRLLPPGKLLARKALANRRVNRFAGLFVGFLVFRLVVLIILHRRVAGLLGVGGFVTLLAKGCRLFEHAARLPNLCRRFSRFPRCIRIRLRQLRAVIVCKHKLPSLLLPCTALSVVFHAHFGILTASRHIASNRALYARINDLIETFGIRHAGILAFVIENAQACCLIHDFSNTFLDKLIAGL